MHTDHHWLKWLMTISDPSGKLARWSLLVQQYDFEIKHRPGVAHGNADAPSCRPYTPPPLTISAYDVPGVQIERVRDFQRRDPDLADLTLLTLKVLSSLTRIALLVHFYSPSTTIS